MDDPRIRDRIVRIDSKGRTVDLRKRRLDGKRRTIVCNPPQQPQDESNVGAQVTYQSSNKQTSRETLVEDDRCSIYSRRSEATSSMRHEKTNSDWYGGALAGAAIATGFMSWLHRGSKVRAHNEGIAQGIEIQRYWSRSQQFHSQP